MVGAGGAPTGMENAAAGGETAAVTGEKKSADLPDFVFTDIDRKMDAVYGDHVHQNDGTHLNGGIADDAEWQARFNTLIVLHNQQYDLPRGRVGHTFIDEFSNIIEGVIDRKWNFERAMVFMMTVLQRTSSVKKAKDVKERLDTRIQAWKDGKFDMLVQTAERDMKANMTNLRGNMTDAKIHKIFDDMMKRGKIRQAARFVTQRLSGGVMMPDDIDEKSGNPVSEVLHSKHPAAKTPDYLPAFDKCPEFVDLDITEDTVSKTARQLKGAAGTGGTDSETIASWLLKFGTYSQRLRNAIARLAKWLSNDNPPWAAYRALMAGRLIALDKNPGVRPIAIGEVLRRLIAKCVLSVAKGEAQEACGIDQLCGGLQAGIEGGVHAMHSMWETHKMEEEWGFLLIDARNAFNEVNRTVMLWVIRHEWPSGARFCFNCYQHHALLVNHGAIGKSVIIPSQEGVTQGDPLSMICYGIAILPLIRMLKREFPTAKQQWYADDGSTAGYFSDIRAQFERLQQIGPNYGYFPESSKSILVVASHNFEQAKVVFADLNFQVVTGSRYLGSFIGETMERDSWIANKVDDWVHSIKKLADAARAYPQSAYSALQRSVQQEWQYLQRTTPNIESCFDQLEKAIQEEFLPALFGEAIEDGDYRLELAHLPVKYSGLALPNTVNSATPNHQASKDVCSHLISALKDETTFETANHTQTMATAKAAIRTSRDNLHEQELKRITDPIPAATKCTILRSQETGQWLQTPPSYVNGTCLTDMEFRDALHLRYCRTPPNLPTHCDGCGAKFSIAHGLECKKGGLVIQRHDEIKFELQDLAARALIPSVVRDEPQIYPSRSAAVEETEGMSTPTEERGDLLIRNLWKHQTDCILDVRITNLDAPSNIHRKPESVLLSHEREKKKKYLQACLDQRRHFSPFVVSCDGVLGKEAKVVLQNLAGRLAKKSGKPYSETSNFMKSRMSIAIVRATHLCIRGSRTPTSRMSQHPQWEDGAGLSLFYY